MSDRNYWLGWSVFPGVGPGKFKLLLDHFKSAEEAWKASQSDLKNIIGEKLALEFETFRKSFSIEKYLKKLEEKEVWFLTQNDPQYPSLLLRTYRSPIILFGRGHPEFISGSNSEQAKMTKEIPKQVRDDKEVKTIAVVGTRKVTSYGREVTEILTRDLVRAGFTIVSGLALGVDAVAHQTAIDEGGKTIAVLGCGVDLCYPSSNKNLYDSIINGNGAVISEYALGMTPSIGSFPSRNRIIAGLSQGVLVTEGAEDSGSLITADYAIKYQRKVFAVPGPITSTLSKGPHQLLEKGAKLVSSSNDFIKEFQISNIKFQINTNDVTDSRQARMTSKFQNLTKDEEKILSILQNEGLHFDEIARKMSMDPAKVGGILTMMEIKGMIKSLENGHFMISNIKN